MEKSKKIKIKTLTPIHIGSGETLSPLDFFIDSGKFYRIDINGLFNDKDFFQRKEVFIKAISKGERFITRILDKNLLNKHILYSIPVNKLVESRNPIETKTFIKSAGRVFIPGSSFKGSILSAIIWKNAREKKIKDISKCLQDDTISDISESPLQSKFSKWIEVRDSDFKKPEESLELVPVYIEGTKGGKHIPTFCEVIKKGIEFEMEIKKGKCKMQIEEILRAMNDFYKKVYEKEKKFPLKQIFPEIPKNGYLTKIGMGASVFSTSYLILAEDLGIKNYEVPRPKIGGRQIPPLKVGMSPTTKKLISGNIPLGWVEVKYVW